MNIIEIKAAIAAQAGLTNPNFTMDIHEQKDAAGVVQPDWVTSWLQEARVRVVMHKEVFTQIQTDRTFSGLALKPMEIVTPTEVGKLPYKRFIVIAPTSIIASF
jgi:hypothetical protein